MPTWKAMAVEEAAWAAKSFCIFADTNDPDAVKPGNYRGGLLHSLESHPCFHVIPQPNIISELQGQFTQGISICIRCDNARDTWLSKRIKKVKSTITTWVMRRGVEGLGGRDRVPWNIVDVSSVTLQYEHHVLLRAATPDNWCDVLLGRCCQSPLPLLRLFSRHCSVIQSSN